MDQAMAANLSKLAKSMLNSPGFEELMKHHLNALEDTILSFDPKETDNIREVMTKRLALLDFVTDLKHLAQEAN